MTKEKQDPFAQPPFAAGKQAKAVPAKDEKRDEIQQTHYTGCWRDPRHHECAVARVADLGEALKEMIAIARENDLDAVYEWDESIRHAEGVLVKAGVLDD